MDKREYADELEMCCVFNRLVEANSSLGAYSYITRSRSSCVCRCVESSGQVASLLNEYMYGIGFIDAAMKVSWTLECS